MKQWHAMELFSLRMVETSCEEIEIQKLVLHCSEHIKGISLDNSLSRHSFSAYYVPSLVPGLGIQTNSIGSLSRVLPVYGESDHHVAV